MAKQKNHVIFSTDQADLARLKEEYEMIGRVTKLEQGKLIIFALSPQKQGRKVNK